MLVYKDTDDIVQSVKQHIEKKIKECERTITTNKANSHNTMRAMAERAAYSDVLWMLTDFTLKSDEHEPTTQVAP